MASERTNDPILDLLFEELDADERKSLRSEVDGDPEMAAELESFELLMGQVRDADLGEDVPDAVHASIMEAARAGASRSQTSPRRARRGPNSEGSIWTRMTGGTGQIALVATVLLAGAFVFRFVQQEAPVPVGDSAEAPLSEMAPDREATNTGTLTGDSDAPSPDLANKRAFDNAQAEASPSEEAEAEEVWEPEPTDSKLRLDDAVAAKPEEEVLPGTKELRQKRPSKSRRRATKKSESKPIAVERELESLLNVSSDSFGESAPTAPTKSAPDTRNSSGVTATAKGKNTADKKVDYLAIEDVDGAEKDAEVAPASETGSAPAATPQDVYEPPAGSPAAIQQTFDSRDYNRTISDANGYLAGESGNSTDRATVMQLKAQSLYNLGRYDQARNVYNSIKRSYPNFRPDQISQALAEIERRVDQKKRKAKPSPRKQESYDFSADEAQDSPSSLQ